MTMTTSLTGAAVAALLVLGVGAGPVAAQSPAPPHGMPAPAAGGPTVADLVKAGKGKDDPVIARVNNVELRRSDVLQTLGALPPQLQQMPMAQVYPLLLERMIDEKLVVGAGRAQKLQDDAEVKRRVQEAEDRAVQQAFLSRSVSEKITDAALRKKYESFVAENPPQEEVRARHILVPTEKAAQDVMAELKKGTDFAAVARSKSTDGSARDGGDLGYFTRGDMVEAFSDAAFAMKPGEVSKAPVKSQFGYHVIKVEDRRMASPPSFEDTRDQLRTELSQDMAAEVVQELRTKAKVERFDLEGKPLAPTPPLQAK